MSQVRSPGLPPPHRHEPYDTALVCRAKGKVSNWGRGSEDGGVLEQTPSFSRQMLEVKEGHSWWKQLQVRPGQAERPGGLHEVRRQTEA